MIELAFWREVGISEATEAEARYQSIIADQNPVPLTELDEQVQRFVHQLRTALPELQVVGQDSSIGKEAHSRFGILVRIGDDMPEDTYGRVMGLAAPTRLTMYDPESQLVMGDDDSIEIEIHESN